MAPAPAPVVVVTEDRPDLYGWVLTRRDHHPGVVGIQLGVAERQAMSVVGEAVLVGLGKDPWLSVSKRPAELLAAAWLSLGEVTDVIVGYPQLISNWLLPDAVAWFVGLGVRPWLVYSSFDNIDEIRAQAEKVAADWGVEVTDGATLTEAWPDVPALTPEPEAVRPSGLPVLPRMDGIRFRSTCRDLLAPDDFAVVDAAFTAAVAELRSEIDELNEKYKTRQLNQRLRGHLAAARDTEELLLWARAAQVAGLPAGFHVRVDTTVLIGAAEALPRPGLADPQRWWEGLDLYRDPDPGAAAALYVAGIDPGVLPALTVGAVDGDTVRHDGNTYEITAGARFVRALARFRRLADAGDDDLLFATHRKSSVSATHVAGLIWSTTTDTGVRVAPTPTERTQPAAKTWLARYGIEVSIPRSDKPELG